MTGPKRRVLRLAGIVIALALGGWFGSARADPVYVARSFSDYCTMGSLRTCASVTLSTLSSDAGTFLTIRIRNLQGTLPADNSTGSAIHHLEISVTPDCARFPYYGCGPFGILPVSNLGPFVVGSVLTYGIHPEYHDPYWDGGSWSMLYQSANLGRGIFGCAPLPVDPASMGMTPGIYGGAWGTCPGSGYDGWIAWQIQWSPSFTADELDVVWGARTAGGQETLCRVSDPSTCTSVVPEPTTLILLSTGLLGIATARSRRRRRS